MSSTTPSPTSIVQIDRDLRLAPFTTLRLGGPAATVIELRDNSHIVDLDRVITARSDGRPLAGVPVEPVPIGGGSNIIVADAGVRRPVILVRTEG